MIKYTPFPINIIYSFNSQEQANYTANEFYAKGDKQMSEWMKATGRALREVTEDSAPIHSAARLQFEHTIKRELDRIARTEVGRLLFAGLNAAVPVWIMPDPDLFWAATTSRIMTVKEGGGIRIKINPDQFSGILDTTLVHELAHAVRRGHDRMYHFEFMRTEWPSVEEFIATQFENIYRSEQGNQKLLGQYLHVIGKYSSKGDIYRYFIEEPQMIQALKFCIDNEPMVKAITKLPAGRPEYNPFRDYLILERMALGKLQTPGSPAGKLIPI